MDRIDIHMQVLRAIVLARSFPFLSGRFTNRTLRSQEASHSEDRREQSASGDLAVKPLARSGDRRELNTLGLALLRFRGNKDRRELALEEKEGTEGLVLCRSGDVFLDSQVGEKGFDLGSAHLGRVTHVLEVDVALDPADVGLLGGVGIVFEADGIADLIQQLLRTVLFHGLTFSV